MQDHRNLPSSSPKGFEDAISAGIARASETIKHIQGAWVSEQKVVVKRARSSTIEDSAPDFPPRRSQA